MLLTGRINKVIEFQHGVVVLGCYGCGHDPQHTHFFGHSTSISQASPTFQGPRQGLLSDKVRAKACPEVKKENGV